MHNEKINITFSKNSFATALLPTVFVMAHKRLNRLFSIIIVFRFLRLSAQLKINVIAIKDFIFKRWV